uniref:Uncharacterized protein n=1 Tax=Arundo donax TaxID=35708 RepID=A0A0A8YHW6_ARUDO
MWYPPRIARKYRGPRKFVAPEFITLQLSQFNPRLGMSHIKIAYFGYVSL